MDDPEQGAALQLADPSARRQSDAGTDQTANRRARAAAISELSEKERSAFVMRHYEGLSIEEIGRVLDLRASAPQRSVFRAVRQAAALARAGSGA